MKEAAWTMRYLLLLLATLLSGSLPTVAQTRRVTGVREADRVCTQCHQEIVAAYLRTPMANSSGLAEERFHPGSFRNPLSGVTYSFEKTAAAARLKYETGGDAAISVSESLQYFLGSGHLGSTYLYSKTGYLLETPVAYYAKISGYQMKPGFQTARETPAALTVNPSCLRCHMSAVKKPEEGTDDLYRAEPFEHTGITCESCHGDTQQHVASAGKSPVINPAKLSPTRRDSTCSVCHLEGDTSVERSGRSVVDFKPGDDISDYLTFFLYARTNTTHRAVSEIEQFLSSRCRIATGPAMSCMNCHDPHSSPEPAQRVSYFRARCLTCHTQPQYETSHYSSNADCTSCHMPQSSARNIAHVAWTDHRILRRPAPESETLVADLPSAPVLEPLLIQNASVRDRALADYNLVVVKGLSSLAPVVYKQLAGLSRSEQNDVAVLRALGILAEMNGDFEAAERHYRQLLVADPRNLAARTNLGALFARRGDLRGAVSLWKPAFDRNEDVPALGENLARAQCQLGDPAGAVKTLQSVLTYSPGLTQARTYLDVLGAANAACARPPQTAAPGTP